MLNYSLFVISGFKISSLFLSAFFKKNFTLIVVLVTFQ